MCITYVDLKKDLPLFHQDPAGPPIVSLPKVIIKMFMPVEFRLYTELKFNSYCFSQPNSIKQTSM